MNSPPRPCCQTPASAARQRCPHCQQAGSPVPAETLQNLLRAEFRPADESGFFYCQSSHCPLVYFRPDGTLIDKQALQIRIGAKEREDPITVCYCFAISRADIAAEIRQHGQSSASQRIEQLMKDNGCDCRKQNPSARCCLTTVRKTEQSLSRQQT